MCGERWGTEWHRFSFHCRDELVGDVPGETVTLLPSATRPAEVTLRKLRAESDHTVLAVHGWDLAPEIGHHSTKLATRSRVCPGDLPMPFSLLVENSLHAEHTS